MSEDVFSLETIVSRHHWSQDTRPRTFIVFRHSVSLDPLSRPVRFGCGPMEMGPLRLYFPIFLPHTFSVFE